MPYNDPDATDPMTLTGVELEVDDPDTVREMAVCFIEEFLRLGLSGEAILGLFTEGEYAGPALAVRQLGRDEIASLIQEQLHIRGSRTIRVIVDRSPDGALNLPVLNS